MDRKYIFSQQLWILILEILEHNPHEVFLSMDFSKITPDQIVVIWWEKKKKKKPRHFHIVFFIYVHTEHK